MAKPGPRGKFTKLVKDAVLEALSLGTSKAEAAEAAGISSSCLSNWEALGHKDIKAGKKTPYGDFVGQIKATRAASVAFHLKCIRDASKAGKWQASAWWLERLHHERYGKTPDTIINNTAIAGAGVSSDLMVELAALDKMSDKDLMALANPKTSATTTVKVKRVRRTKAQIKAEVKKLLAAGTPKAQIHIQMNVGKTTVTNILKELP